MASNRSKKTKIKPGEKIDRISSLPDPIIHHILSFLPSTLTATETCVLSKRWRYQWTHVLVLIFDYRIPKTHFSTFVDSVLILHDSPTITKFFIRTCNLVGHQLHSLLPWIRFAMRKQVKELSLDFGYDVKLELPRFFFDNDSLVKFKAVGLDFSSCEQVNWSSLKVLSVESCIEFEEAIGNIVHGSPLLESLQFMCDDWNVPIVLASTSLKRLVIVDSDEIDEGAALEIACPNLEELKFSYTFLFESYKLVDLPSSAHVTLDLRDNNFCNTAADLEADENKVKQILQSVKHVDVLNIGCYCLQVFSVWVVVKSLSSPRMNTKCLTLNVSNFDHDLPGIVSILHNSPVLEKLVINFDFGTLVSETDLESYDFGEKY